MINICSVTLPVEDTPCNCEYITPSVKTAKFKKDEYGNWVVMVNDDGKWIGATLDLSSGTFTFSY